MLNSTTGIKPLDLAGFRGIYARGENTTIPKDHLFRCWNCVFPGKDQVDMRESVTISSGTPVTGPLQAAQVISYFIAETPNGAALITLNSDGHVYDETHATTLIFVAGATAMHGLNAFGRTYLGFTLNGKAVGGFGIYCYYFDGVNYVLSPLAGLPPIVAPVLTQPNAGHVDIGIHTVAVSFQNARGYVSPPSPVATINSTGVNDITLNNIPTGPAGTVARVILVSKANESELFFLPNGTINDNVTILQSINFYDTDLLNSADYLNDIIAHDLSATAIRFYRGRMVLIGNYPYPDAILVSNVSNPETFDAVRGVINMPISFGDNTSSSAIIIRDTLYVTKPNGTYSVQDNGNDPSTWAVSVVDAAIGALNGGISLYASAMSSQDVFDSALVAHRSGLRIFQGSYSDPPLTWKIEDIWNTINSQDFWRIRIAHDTVSKRVYIAVPLTRGIFDNGNYDLSLDGLNHCILMMDYKEGLNPDTVKWSFWDSQITPKIYHMSMENFTLNYAGAPQMIYQLSLCSGTPHVFKIIGDASFTNNRDTDLAGNYTVGINQLVYSYPISLGRGVGTFLRVDYDMEGVGGTDLRLTGKFGGSGTGIHNFILDNYNGQIAVLERLINYNDEFLCVIVRNGVNGVAGIGARFALHGLHVYGKLMWPMRPAYVERL